MEKFRWLWHRDKAGEVGYKGGLHSEDQIARAEQQNFHQVQEHRRGNRPKSDDDMLRFVQAESEMLD